MSVQAQEKQAYQARFNATCRSESFVIPETGQVVFLVAHKTGSSWRVIRNIYDPKTKGVEQREAISDVPVVEALSHMRRTSKMMADKYSPIRGEDATSYAYEHILYTDFADFEGIIFDTKTHQASFMPRGKNLALGSFNMQDVQRISRRRLDRYGQGGWIQATPRPISAELVSKYTRPPEMLKKWDSWYQRRGKAELDRRPWPDGDELCRLAYGAIRHGDAKPDGFMGKAFRGIHKNFDDVMFIISMGADPNFEKHARGPYMITPIAFHLRLALDVINHDFPEHKIGVCFDNIDMLMGAGGSMGRAIELLELSEDKRATLSIILAKQSISLWQKVLAEDADQPFLGDIKQKVFLKSIQRGKKELFWLLARSGVDLTTRFHPRKLDKSLFKGGSNRTHHIGFTNIAARLGDAQTLQDLADLGAPFPSMDEAEELIDKCIEKNHIDCLPILFRQCSALRVKAIVKCLQTGIEKRDLDMCETVFTHSDKMRDPDLANILTPYLRKIVASGDPGLFDMYIDSGFAYSLEDHDGWAGCMAMAHPKVLGKLLDMGLNVHQQPDVQPPRNAIDYAAGAGRLENIKMLESAGLKLTTQAANLAMRMGHLDCLEYMAKQNLFPNLSYPKPERNILEISKFLVAHEGQISSLIPDWARQAVHNELARTAEPDFSLPPKKPKLPRRGGIFFTHKG